jgi:hypothetical protein
MAVNRGWGLLEMRSASMSLEEVFIQLTTDEAAVANEATPPDRTSPTGEGGEEVG